MSKNPVHRRHKRRHDKTKRVKSRVHVHLHPVERS